MLNSQSINMCINPLLQWYDKNKRPLPWRKTQAPYQIWLSEIMLQQTRVQFVIPYYQKFIKEIPTITALAQYNEQKLLKLWEGMGYYQRIRNMQKAAKILAQKYHGQMPSEYEEILKLPGIGAYTAGAIASICYGKKIPAVDGNLLRVFSRYLNWNANIAKESSKKELFSVLKESMPNRPGDFNQAVMDLGAMICVPNAHPKCSICPLRHFCKGFAKGTCALLPVKENKKAKKIEFKTVLLLTYQNKIAICRRKNTKLLANLWEFPNIEGIRTPEEIQHYLKSKNICTVYIRCFMSSSHTFTHLQWKMKSYLCQIQKPPIHDQIIFVDKQEFIKYPFPAAFQKISEKILPQL